MADQPKYPEIAGQRFHWVNSQLKPAPDTSLLLSKEVAELFTTPAGQKLKAAIEEGLDASWRQGTVTELGLMADGLEKIAARDARLAPGLREAIRLMRLRIESVKKGE